VQGSKHSLSCSACRVLLRLRCQHRLEHFQAHYVSQDEAQHQEELEVVEMEVAEEVPFVFAIPTGRTAPFVEEEEDFWRPRGSTAQICPSGFPAGDGHGGGACGSTAPPSATTQTGEPPPSGVLWPGSVRRRERRRYRAPTAPVPLPLPLLLPRLVLRGGFNSSTRGARPGDPDGPLSRLCVSRGLRDGVHRPPGDDGRWEEVSRRRWLSPPRMRGRIQPPLRLHLSQSKSHSSSP